MSHQRALEFLKDPHLRFSSPLSFNDPFEFRPEVSLEGSREEVERVLAEFGVAKGTKRAEAERQVAAQLHKVGVSSYHVICFAEDPLELTMWGHYGSSHEGCVLGFDSELFEPMRQRLVPVQAGPVTYSARRPVLKLPANSMTELMQTVIFSKGVGWSYEREWRIALVHGAEHSSFTPRPMIFPPDLLRVVIAGARCDNTRFRALRSALDSLTAFKEVDLARARISHHGYSFELAYRNGEPFNLSNFTDDFSKVRELRRSRGGAWTDELRRRRAAKESAEA